MTVQNRRLWLAAGWLTIGYVVLTFAGVAFGSNNVTVGDKPSKVAKALVQSSLTMNFGSYYVEFIATLVLLAGGLLLARLVREATELGDWLSSVMSAAAISYVAVTMATGGAAGAAALYNAHHGASLATVTTVNDIRNFGFSITGGLAGVFVLATSAAMQRTARFPRWFVYVGYGVGVVLIAAVPAAKSGAPQIMLWYLWLVVVGVLALRAPHKAVAVTARAVPTAV